MWCLSKWAYCLPLPLILLVQSHHIQLRGPTVFSLVTTGQRDWALFLLIYFGDWWCALLSVVSLESAVMKPLCTGLQRVLLQRKRRLVSAETDTFSLLSAAQFKTENTKKSPLLYWGHKKVTVTVRWLQLGQRSGLTRNAAQTCICEYICGFSLWFSL